MSMFIDDYETEYVNSDGTKWKKKGEYKNESGETYKKVGETVNDAISLDPEETMKSWIELGFNSIKGDKIKGFLDPKDNWFVKYYRKDGMCRGGGFLSKVEDEYIGLRNIFTGFSWTVQYDHIELLFYKHPNKKKKTEDDDPVKQKYLESLNFTHSKDDKISFNKVMTVVRENHKDAKITKGNVKYFVRSLKQKK